MTGFGDHLPPEPRLPAEVHEMCAARGLLFTDLHRMDSEKCVVTLAAVIQTMKYAGFSHGGIARVIGVSPDVVDTVLKPPKQARRGRAERAISSLMKDEIHGHDRRERVRKGGG